MQTVTTLEMAKRLAIRDSVIGKCGRGSLKLGNSLLSRFKAREKTGIHHINGNSMLPCEECSKITVQSALQTGIAIYNCRLGTTNKDSKN